MNDSSAGKPSHPTSGRKAASNRRNARKSTGPKTAQGKAWSRLNALKHGILASQAVITTVEGREERKAFEELVDGLAADFAPVGTFEQVLVQQIGACIWRQRRLLRFENRAAFRSRDDRTYREMNQRLHGMAPLYLVDRDPMEGEEILDQAGLGLDLPSERDTMRLVRYEGSITRSLRNALAQLKAMQQARHAAGGGTPAAIAPKHEDRPVVVDARAKRRNRGPAALRMPVKASFAVHAKELELAQAERAEEARRGAAAAAEAADTTAENYQTKPNMPEDPEALEKHQRLLETADSVIRLSETLTPKRPPSQD